jgi:hypothetical protein
MPHPAHLFGTPSKGPYPESWVEIPLRGEGCNTLGVTQRFTQDYTIEPIITCDLI